MFSVINSVSVQLTDTGRGLWRLLSSRMFCRMGWSVLPPFSWCSNTVFSVNTQLYISTVILHIHSGHIMETCFDRKRSSSGQWFMVTLWQPVSTVNGHLQANGLWSHYGNMFRPFTVETCCRNVT